MPLLPPVTTPTPPGANDGLVRRFKALACTAPLHDLDHRKGLLEWADASVYQMAETALHIVDVVTLAMDFDRGASPGEVVARAVPFVAAQAPDRTAEEHRRVAEWVLERLVNVGSHTRGFDVVYGAPDADGTYQRRTWSFKLIVELADGNGQIYLRSTDEAVNVLVGALDTDVESAQEAAETKLDSLVRRGRLSQAQAVAIEARLRTIQYADALRRRLEATRRDVRAVDWDAEVPDLLVEALDHVDSRVRAETAILTNIAIARDNATDPGHKRRAAELVNVVKDCLRRHHQLHARLITAGAIFRAEQDRQQFAFANPLRGADLFGQVLRPVLDLTIEEASPVIAAYWSGGRGTSVPAVSRLLDTVGLLLAPPTEREDLGAELPAPDLAPAAEPDVFSAHQLARSQELLATCQQPTRLSELLRQVESNDPGLAHLLALRALHAVDPELGASLRQGDNQVLVAVDDGNTFNLGGVSGADVLLINADLQLRT